MSQCSARVLSVDSDHVWVETDPRAVGCGNCDKPGGCHSGFFAKEPEHRRYRVPNTIGAVAGEQVQLVTADGALLKSALLAYGVPVVLLLIGAAVGQWTGGDIWAINGAVLGLALGVAILRKAEIHRLENARNTPILVVEKMDSTTCQSQEQK